MAHDLFTPDPTSGHGLESTLVCLQPLGRNLDSFFIRSGEKLPTGRFWWFQRGSRYLEAG
ncbi:MAG: hypothetical protein ABIZ81_04750 [Opitutaceae bacterium]